MQVTRFHVPNFDSSGILIAGRVCFEAELRFSSATRPRSRVIDRPVSYSALFSARSEPRTTWVLGQVPSAGLMSVHDVT
jgi:hypothetical protein